MNINYLDQYKKYILIRKFEEKIVEIFPTDKIKSPVHLSLGQEIPSVITSSFYRPGDKVYLSYRSHAGYLAFGGDPNKFMAELYGKETGCSKGYGGSMHLIDLEKGIAGTSAIVASHIPVAVGDAWVQKKENTGNIVFCFFGDGATEVGTFFESINIANLFQLPIVFICENNLWADSSDIRYRRPFPFIDLYIKPWFENRSIWIKEPETMDNRYYFTKSIIDDTRKDKKPRFIEFIDERKIDHVGIANIKSNPISYENFNINKEEAEKIVTDSEQIVQRAIDFAESSLFPEKLCG